MTSPLLIRNGVVIDTEPEPAVLGRMDVRIEDGAIAEVGPGLPAVPGAEVIDATERIVLPGFVDTHRHTWQAAIRAVAPDIVFDDYLRRVLGEIAPRYRAEDVHAGNLAGALECLDAGVTTVLDWSHVQFSPGHTEAAVRALHESGIRAVFGYCYGGEPNGLTAETRRVHALLSGAPGLVTMALAALGPEIAGQERALEEWRVAAELGLPVTAHLGGHSRDSAERELAFLEANGLLATPTTFVHALHYTDDEFKRIAAAGGSASYAPVDEMALGIGYPAAGRARAAGVPASLGADTVVCAPGDMFSLMRAVHLLERGRPGGAGLGFTTRDALRMATIEGAEVLGLADAVGSLRPGKQADLVLLRTDTPGMAAVQDPIGAVVLHADTAAVDTVLVAGRVVKRDGRLLHHDVAAVLAALKESAATVLAA
ncbi:amidohydrolase family protein [Nonomuraea phyllanthi]|uniref:Amidohydrolase family protein n=1 Tax=Nonomuraea phyllanthi TaxID=2219224 RepID=A0A5C4WW09_9ACTN|nr:amidohydrolase family protein [Nonomuraea phyllanthi]KAB8197788.1 amidohydrolase family protein [Nonomuraea phyllanthi]